MSDHGYVYKDKWGWWHGFPFQFKSEEEAVWVRTSNPAPGEMEAST